MNIEPNAQYRDKDPRRPRTVTVVEVTEDVVQVKNEETGKVSLIQRDRFEKRWELTSEPKAAKPKAEKKTYARGNRATRSPSGQPSEEIFERNTQLKPADETANTPDRTTGSVVGDDKSIYPPNSLRILYPHYLIPKNNQAKHAWQGPRPETDGNLNIS